MNWWSLGISRVDMTSGREKEVQGIPGDGWSMSNVSGEENDGDMLVAEHNRVIGHSLGIRAI